MLEKMPKNDLVELLTFSRSLVNSRIPLDLVGNVLV